MVGKNNKTGQFRRQANEDKRYTLKKLSVGLASVALGTVLFLGQVNAVNAEEVDSDIEDNLPDDFTDEEAAERRAEEDILLTENENNAEAPAEKTVFQFSYMEAGTGKKMDGFFGEYVNANEAEKAFRMYANEAGYTLENIQFNNNSFTATIAPSSTDRYVEAAKSRARNLISGLDGLTDELKADYLEQVGAAVSVEEVEVVYNEAIEMATQQKEETNRYVAVAKDRARQLIKDLTNLTNDQKAQYLAKVEAATSVAEVEAIHAEAENVVNETPAPNRFVKIARDHARQLINKLGNLYDNQKADYIKRVDEADSVKAIEGILEEAQKHVNSAKGGENGQAPTQPNKPSYDGDLTPTPEAPAKSELDQAKMKATADIKALGYFTAKEKQDLLGRVKDYDNTGDIHFIVTKAQQENEKRHQLHRKLLELQFGTNPNNSLPEAGKPQNANPEADDNKPDTDDKQPEQPEESELDRAKAGALADIEALKNFSEKEKKDLIDRVNGYDNVGDIDFIITKAQEQDDARYKKQQNDDYDTLEAKADKTLNELLDLTKKVDQAAGGEVDQDLLESIQAKATELEMVLAEIQQHISSLPEAEAQEATQLVKKLQALLEKVKEKYSFEEVTPAEEAKERAKAYLNKEFGKDLNDMQREVYAKAIDQIKNDDPDYEKKVQDIVQVAIAEVFVSKAESDRHIENAKKALAAASQETEGGQLIDGKDELIMSLQTRLAKVISEQDQTDQTPPSVEKQPEKEQTPPVEKEKEQVPTESEELKGKKEALRNFVDGIKSLSNEQKKFYLELLDSSKSVTQIEELFELFDAETLLARTKSGELPKEQVLPGIEEKLNKVFDKELKSKKAELQAELDKLTGKEDAPAPEVEEEPKATFAEKRVELTGIISEWNMLYKDLATEGGKKVATKEQHAKLTGISNRFKKVFAEWEGLAKTDIEKKSVEGLKTTLYHVYTTIPNVK